MKLDFLKKIGRPFRAAIMLILIGSAGAGCSGKTAVSVHGVNYTEEPFFYAVFEGDELEATVGETIEPYSAGGIVCCYSLPDKWRPHLTVRVRTTVWNKKSDGALSEVTKTEDVEVPAYFTSSPGELWVVREPNGSISAVSSDYQPNHPKWPGRIKGWPVPSLAYRQERWKALLKFDQDNLNLANELLQELKDDPEDLATREWDHAKKKMAGDNSYDSFQGPKDPKFRAQLKSEYEHMKARNEEKVKRLMEAKP